MKELYKAQNSKGAQAGNGTVLMLAVICLGFFALVTVLMLTAASNAATKAASAADLAALAGADAARFLIPGEPCSVATSSAHSNEAILTQCSRMGANGEIVQISVKVPVSIVGWLPPLSVATGTARAGPPPQPWLTLP
ncbi:hypothetical protein CQ018_03240 [Arthrobacter sp. MYb227]|uniref:Rv3654c family TadE-like protein n=1 Tax=Arthrobacter sp. MYb227 TaxID=1848601 RepID=UPI000CFB301B|nr:Rv3654c family TadE-like protein [Arthrobacter sp. MYb227]PQZ96297.1 hypothetical protein CQ018_03240 [Arthrobacter sp. MYb227]